MSLAPGLAHAAAVDLYYERTVMMAADGRCRLFPQNVSAALASSQAQARGAALRAGVDPAELDRVAARASGKAMAEPCASPSITTAAARVRSAFEGYARLMKMNFAGDHLDWTAERLASKSGRVWNLSQSSFVGRDPLTFGLVRQGDVRELVAVTAFSDGAQPYAARLILRDPVKAKKPYLDYRKADAKGMLPLAGRMAPDSANVAFMADARFDPDPLLTKARDAIGYRFPAAAAKALSDLDPREAVAVEFLFQGAGGRTITRRALLEVGDFTAGRAFLAAAQR